MRKVKSKKRAPSTRNISLKTDEDRNFFFAILIVAVLAVGVVFVSSL